MKKLCVICCVLFVLGMTSAQGGQLANWVFYFGNLHAHSSISDGKGTPNDAFAYAKNSAKVHLLCLSEHNHLSTQDGLNAVQEAARDYTTAHFIGLYGQEFSTVSKGNHVNVYGLTGQLPKADNYNFRKLYTVLLPAAEDETDLPIVCQFNHPESVKKDYGMAKASATIPNYANDTAAFFTDADRWVRLIALINGPTHETQRNTLVAFNTAYLNAWYYYQEHGMHLSPVADQDNHEKNWGDATTARTVILLRKGETASADVLLKALRFGRCYATNDTDLKVIFTLNGQPMGTRYTEQDVAAQGQKLTMTVGVTDADDKGGTYRIELYRNIIGDTLPPKLVTLPPGTVLTVANKKEWTAVIYHTPNTQELYFVHLSRVNGKGEAWTAPIWIEHQN
jgi:hypothetical protein